LYRVDSAHALAISPLLDSPTLNPASFASFFQEKYCVDSAKDPVDRQNKFKKGADYKTAPAFQKWTDKLTKKKAPRFSSIVN